jgi:predicted membrane chloride channel (bestrophin family)
MKANWNRGLKFALFVVLAIAVSSLLVMVLWNWLVPTLFGLPAISFLQALGLLILTRILFGGFRGHHFYRRWRMKQRWKQMTPDEREKFRKGRGLSSDD